MKARYLPTHQLLIYEQTFNSERPNITIYDVYSIGGPDFYDRLQDKQKITIQLPSVKFKYVPIHIVVLFKNDGPLSYFDGYNNQPLYSLSLFLIMKDARFFGYKIINYNIQLLYSGTNGIYSKYEGYNPGILSTSIYDGIFLFYPYERSNDINVILHKFEIYSEDFESFEKEIIR